VKLLELSRVREGRLFMPLTNLNLLLGMLDGDEVLREIRTRRPPLSAPARPWCFAWWYYLPLSPAPATPTGSS